MNLTRREFLPMLLGLPAVAKAPKMPRVPDPCDECRRPCDWYKRLYPAPCCTCRLSAECVPEGNFYGPAHNCLDQEPVQAVQRKMVHPLPEPELTLCRWNDRCRTHNHYEWHYAGPGEHTVTLIPCPCGRP